MKVVNETSWNTKDLKTIAVKVLEQYPTDTTSIKFVYTRPSVYRDSRAEGQNYVTGLAACPGSWVLIRLPKSTAKVKVAGSNGVVSYSEVPQTINSVELAAVLAHEFAHNRGIQHGDMLDHINDCTVAQDEAFDEFGWAKSYPVRLKETKEDTPKVVVDLKVKRKAKVENKLAKLVHQRELLDARIKKLEKKQKYYEYVSKVAS